MEHFIFNTALENQLNHLLHHVNQYGGIICLYGGFGIGKTTFAKYLADHVAIETIHYDCATKCSLDDIKSTLQTVCIDSVLNDADTRIVERCFILDEFHNLTTKQKDAFKITLETIAKETSNMVIIIANTDSNNPLTKVLTPAIISRCYSICFDPTDYEEIASKLLERYPTLPESIIRNNYPDMRQIIKQAKVQDC